ncbi:MAG: glycosyltransferase family 2 protein [Candidatus Bathyarchaeia archaeon]
MKAIYRVPRSDLRGCWAMDGAEWVSIIIPVRGWSPILDLTLERLLSDPFRPKEFIVVVDDPNELTEAARLRFEPRGVRFLLNERRLGKAESLNRAIPLAKGEILLFLDADVLVPEGEILGKVAKAMEGIDLLEIKKDVFDEALLQRMVRYEYLEAAAISQAFSVLAGGCPAINGAAFAIRRGTLERLGGFARAISEDFELCTRAMRVGAKFKHISSISVKTGAPANFSEWWGQRRRWGVGLGEWIKANAKDLLKYAIAYPRMLLAGLSIAMPLAAYALFAHILSDRWPDPVVELLILAMSTGLTSPLDFPPFLASLLARALLAMVSSYAILSIAFFAISKKLGFDFNPIEFALFLFIYQPISLLVLAFWAAVGIVGIRPRMDWVV